MLILASASTPRHRLLEQAGILHQIIISGVDEGKIQNSNPKKLVEDLAIAKAEAVKSKLLKEASRKSFEPKITSILGCDSIFEFQGEIFGKPKDDIEALDRWKRMSSNSGFLHTGHCLIFKLQNNDHESNLKFDGLITNVVSTEIEFSEISQAEIEDYVNTGEPLKSAGGFALEGKGAKFIKSINGCYSNVIGLSLPWIRECLISERI